MFAQGSIQAPGTLGRGKVSRIAVFVSRRPESLRRFVQSVIMKAIATVIVLSAGLLVHAQAPAPKSAPANGSPTRPSAAHAAAASPSLLNPASLKAKAPAVFKAKFTTNAGDFVVEVHREWAPRGAERFYNLVRYGYFTNAAFFRVVPGFVVQFGLSADPAVNKIWKTATIPDDPVVQSNKRGYLVFATAGPNTRTTQLFINYADNARLDRMGFAPFGNVVEGMDVVDKIYPVYGESPRQDLITEQGDAYLKAKFPDIDRIKLARIVPAIAPATHAPAGAKPAAKPSLQPAQH
jgi:peptidyl-prolyl cis-trans isomerase A (cyclophilin A)